MQRIRLKDLSYRSVVSAPKLSSRAKRGICFFFEMREARNLHVMAQMRIFQKSVRRSMEKGRRSNERFEKADPRSAGLPKPGNSLLRPDHPAERQAGCSHAG